MRNEHYKGSSATVTVTVRPKNDQPTGNSLSLDLDEDNSASFTLTGDDQDPMPTEIQELTIQILEWPSFGALTVDPSTGVGQYSPGADYNGSDSFTYVLIDDATAGGPALTSEPITVPIVVNPINDKPKAYGSDTEGAATTLEQEAVWITTINSDEDPEVNQTLTYSLYVEPSHGSVEPWGDGIMIYTPSTPDYSSGVWLDSFQYFVTDDELAGPAPMDSDPATINVEIHFLNDDPVAVDENAATDIDTPVTVDIRSNDYDPDVDHPLSTLTHEIISVFGGEAYLDGDNVIFTPSAGYEGRAWVDYQIVDPLGGYSMTGVLEILVGSPLLASGTRATAVPALDLDRAMLTSLVAESRTRWETSGIDTSLLGDVEVRVSDLPANQLALAAANVIIIDSSAAGYGWFVDATPQDNGEFRQVSSTEFRARRTSDAYGRIDLLTAIMHEMGHLLGEQHTRSGLMAETLAAGGRKLPTGDLAWAMIAYDDFYSNDDELDDLLLDSQLAT
jgi:hypothetical protein